MKILILGAGQIGRIIAENLISETNEITVIDTNADQLRALQDTLDLRGLVGNATSPSVLSSAGAMDTDLLIAVTTNDETNLVACTLAAQLYNIPIRIARVRNNELMDYKRVLGEEGFRATNIIWPEQVVAEHLAQLITYPTAQLVLSFAENLLTLLTVRATAGASMVGRTLREIFIQIPDIQARFVYIYRRNRRLPLHPDTIIEAGDEVTVLVETKAASSLLQTLHPMERAESVVLINGGSLSGLIINCLKENNRGTAIKVFESDEHAAKHLSNQFNDNDISVALIKATDKNALHQEGISTADVVLTLSHNDEANIMNALLAKSLGAKRTIVLLEKKDYSPLVRGTDIDITVPVSQASLGELLRHIRFGDVLNVQSLYRDGIEAIEIVTHGSSKSSRIVGKKLEDIAFPSGVTVGAVIRGEKDESRILMPEGDLTLQAEDHLILFVPNKKLIARIEQMFALDVGFF